MRFLWAPWRIVYINKLGQQKGCFLCQTWRAKNDQKNLVLVRGKRCLALMNKYPYNTGHLLVVPKVHKGDLEALQEDEALELFRLTCDMKKLLAKVLKPQGFNIGVNLGAIAGAGLKEHFHIHLVPRWRGDTNFMPILADTKVIAQALDHLYQRLKRGL